LQPELEIVGAPTHGGRIVFVTAETGIAVEAEESAPPAGLVIVIDAKILLRSLQADGTKTALSSEHRMVIRHGHPILLESAGERGCRPWSSASFFIQGGLHILFPLAH
jgi:hypothetical protein